MTDDEILASLDSIDSWRPSCVVEEDPGEVVRHAAPLDDRARQQLREQAIARMRRDPEAVRARERRLAIEQGSKVREMRRRA